MTHIKKYWGVYLSLGIILGCCFFVTQATAENNKVSGKDWSGDDIYRCNGSYGSSTCQRVEILDDKFDVFVQEQKQQNNLIAYQTCGAYYNAWLNYGTSDIDSCVEKVLNETK